MGIDPATGLVLWTPPADAVVANPVVIQVADHAGLTGTQAFTLRLEALLPFVSATGESADQTLIVPYAPGGIWQPRQLVGDFDPVHSAIGSGDFTGDGYPDLVLGGSQNGCTLYLLVNDGANGFGLPQTLAAVPGGRAPTFLTVTDFNADGRPDVAVGTNVPNVIYLALSDGMGYTAATSTAFSVVSSGSAYGMDAADLNGDGRPDLIVSYSLYTNKGTYVALNHGAGDFQAATLVSPKRESDERVTAADFTNDARIDLLIGGRISSSTRLLTGNGDGTFNPPTDLTFTHAIGYYAGIDNGDFNGDGNQDLLCTRMFGGGRDLLCYPGNGDGTFATAVVLHTTPSGTWTGLAAPPAPFPDGWPSARISPTNPTVAAGTPVSFDASTSTATSGATLVAYAWTFSDGSTATGPSVTHAGPDQEGVCLVRLAVTDDQGRVARTGTYVYQRGAPPVAGAGGPYIRGEAAAQFGVYTLSLDASGSSDDGPASALSYRWDLGGGFYEAFSSLDLDPVRWRSVGASLTAGRALLTGVGNWTDRQLRAKRSLARTPGAAIDLAVRLDSVTEDGQALGAFGFYDPVSGAYLTEFRLDTTNSSNRRLIIREAGLADRWITNALYLDTDYDLRFLFRAAGFELWLRETGTASWRLLAESTTGTWQTAALMVSANQGALLLDSLSVPNQTCSGVAPVLTFAGPGTYTVGLTVTDAFGQSATDQATIRLDAGSPPVANPGGPYLAGEEVASQGVWTVTLNGSGSTDDRGIATYRWDFGDGTLASGATVQHAYTVPGLYGVSLTVTDHADQTSTAATTVTITVNNSPTANPGGPYDFGEAYAYRGQWSVPLDGTASTDDRGLWQYRWSFPDSDAIRFAGNGTGAVLFPDHAALRTGAITVLLRLRLDAVTADDAIVAKYTDSSRNGFSVENWGDSTSTFYFFTASNLSNAANTVLPVGRWTDIAFTCANGSTKGIVIDGRLAASQAGVSVPASASELILGNLYDGTTQIGGDVDRLAVWSRALTQSEIQERLAHGISPAEPDLAGLWNFTDGSLADEGPYGLDGRIVGSGVGPVTLDGPTVEMVFAEAGVQSTILAVTDHAGQTHATETTVRVHGNEPPVANAGTPQTVEVGMPLTLDASASTDDYGIWTWQWQPGETPLWRAKVDTLAALPDGLLVQAGLAVAVRDPVTFVPGDTVEFTLQRQANRPSYFIGLATDDAPSTTDDDYALGFFLNDNSLTYIENGTHWYSTLRVDVSALPLLEVRITRTTTGARFEYRGIGQSAWTLLRASTYNPPLDRGFFLAASTNSTGSPQALLRRVIRNGQMVPLPRNLGPLADNPAFEVRYARPGVYHPQVTVTDHAGQSATAQTTVTVVVGQPPVARVGGPYQTTEVTPTRLDAAAASDDYAIEWYYWDFGDGDSAVTADPWMHHAYAVAGEYTLTLTVLDFAGQSASTSTPVSVAPGPHVACVPWAFRGGIELPHDIRSGRETTLKAMTWSKRLPLAYTWDFGDGSARVSGTLATAAELYAVQARHTYTAAEGMPFIATLTVTDADGNTAMDRYLMRIRTPVIEVDANLALDEGMWYLHRRMTRGTLAKGTWGNWIVPIGDYSDGNGAGGSKAASPGQVFLVNGHLPSADPRRDPYVDNAWRVLLKTCTEMETIGLSPQAYGDPDTDGNGVGVNLPNASVGYELGPVMDSLVALGLPAAHAPIGAAGVGYRQWKGVLRDLADTIFWGQTDDTSAQGGAWRYGWNMQEQDNSAAQWPVIGLWPAEKLLGIRTPDWVRTQLRRWLDYSNRNGFFGYLGGSSGFSPRLGPSAMMQLAFVGAVGRDDPATAADDRDPLLAFNEDYIAARWSDRATWYKLTDPECPYSTYGYYGFFKAMRMAVPGPVTRLRATGLDWFWDDTTGFARRIAAQQHADGGWGIDAAGPETFGSGAKEHLTAAWNLLMLSPSLFLQAPVADAGPSRTWGVGPQFPDLVLDGSRSYHLDPFQHIILYEWDVDGDGNVETSSPNPVITVAFRTEGIVVNGSIPASAGRAFPASGLPYEVRPVLYVRDSNVPELTDRSSTIIRLTDLPHAPVAVIGAGDAAELPACVGAPVTLDGSHSFDIDPADTITAYAWDLDNDGAYDDGSGPAALATFPAPGLYVVGLQVLDNGVGNGGTPLAGEGFAVVNVSTNTAPVLNPAATLTLAGITEDDTDPPGTRIAALLASDPTRVPDPITDADGDPEGIALEAATAPHAGRWQYRPDAAQPWRDLPAVEPHAALLLADTAFVRYLPDLAYNNGGYAATLTVRAWDHRSGYAGQTNADSSAATGNGSAFSLDTDVVTCPVADVNDPPVIVQGAELLEVVMDEDGAPTPWQAPPLAATDPDLGEVLTWTTVPPSGWATVAGTGASPAVFTYEPPAGWHGEELLTVRVHDAAGAAADIQIRVTVRLVNQPPTATPQTLATPQDTPLPITLGGSDPDADPLSFTVVDPPAHGTLSGTAPDLVYTPTPHYAGPDSFTFSANDGTVDSAAATVALTVIAIVCRPHQADQNGDWIIQLSPELTRLIQFYNRGGYHCQTGTEDGYAPGPPGIDPADTACRPHQADQNADWTIQLSPELTRLIQFYNSGTYHCETGTEDGYAPAVNRR
jgi:hypothetical protein